VLPSYPHQEKDAVLNRIAPDVNIAQFVSFAPDLKQRFAWITGRPPNEIFHSLEEACAVLLNAAESHKLNIRSFKPGATKGNKLAENIGSVGEAVSVLRRRAANGFFTIANELVPLNDGGVSGVAAGGVIEFAPGDTPKCVDKPEVTSLPLSEGMRLLQIVYGFQPDVDSHESQRVEFSLHPIRRGFRREHTIIWELEPCQPVRTVQIGKWPNRFSKFLGDKAYGLLIGHLLGFSVPWTVLVGRGVAPFVFGEETGTKETWIRTCPRVPVAGKYPTLYGWQDPYALLDRCDPDGHFLASVLAQESVDFVWSGAAQTTDHGPQVEGTKGRGDAFMLGIAAKTDVPGTVLHHVIELHRALAERLRSVKFEWVWDGRRVWLVQLHQRRKGLAEDVIYPGEPKEHQVFDPRSFDPEEVLDRLRDLVAEVEGRNIGVIVTGNVGVTSHIGDILAEAKIPSRLKWWDSEDATQLPLELDPV